MPWCYIPFLNKDEKGNQWVEVRELIWDSFLKTRLKKSWTVDAQIPMGETKQELIEELKYMLMDMKRMPLYEEVDDKLRRVKD